MPRTALGALGALARAAGAVEGIDLDLWPLTEQQEPEELVVDVGEADGVATLTARARLHVDTLVGKTAAIEKLAACLAGYAAAPGTGDSAGSMTAAAGMRAPAGLMVRLPRAVLVDLVARLDSLAGQVGLLGDGRGADCAAAVLEAAFDLWSAAGEAARREGHAAGETGADGR